MSWQPVSTTRAGQPRGAYSQGAVVGDLLFITGCIPIDPIEGHILGTDVAEQTNATLDNIESILREAGRRLSDVVKCTVYLADTAMFTAFNEAYARRFSAPYPVRTTIGADLRHIPGALLEIDAIATSH